jgi:methylenetetrahydrofolate reductase (NADPH)
VSKKPLNDPVEGSDSTPALPTAPDKLSVQRLVKDYSIEVTPPQATRIDRFVDLVAPNTRVYIPQTPRGELRDILTLAVRLRTERMDPVPHVVARRIESLARADEFLARLVGEAGVTRVLLVAGDVARPAGELHSALQILESGLLEKHGIHTVGVAGHPEGHPVLGDSVLRDALRRKRAYAERTGASVYIVTQFVFSADPIIAWEQSLGVDIGSLPVVVGLPGLATANTLVRYALECGVGASLQAFARRYSSMTKLLQVSAPGDSLVALARYRDQTPRSHLTNVHFYTFNSFESTTRWANEVLAGHFALTAAGTLALTGRPLADPFPKPEEDVGRGLQES